MFDSGVGGLSVWREIVRELPHESTVYFADQAHVPYGPRHPDQIRRFCDAITRFMIDLECKAVVVACNTASAAALKHIRETFPDLPSIGMEPAVKPAAAITQSGVVGIMATPATFQGRLFKATAGRYASGIKLINQVCDGLADHIELGDLDGPSTDAILKKFLEPILSAGADTIVLACTHYPFVIEPIRRLAGPRVHVIDPAPAIARHVRRVLEGQQRLVATHTTPTHHFVTSGPVAPFQAALKRLVNIEAESVRAEWRDEDAVVASDSVRENA